MPIKKSDAKIGIIFQNPDNQIVATIVEEDVAFGPENLGIEPKEIRRRVDESLEKASRTYKKHIEEGLILPSQQGKPVTEETKKKISESMKKAHKEGRAWNIGKSRWNNKHSYPEEFFIQVINNEFEDKNYVCEYPLEIYSLDFAWIEKKKCIEIDGDQHQRFENRMERNV